MNVPSAAKHVQSVADINSTPRPREGRAHWLDCARGIGIILVVIGHSAGGLIAGDPGKVNPVLVTLFEGIYSFHMPLFFALSSLFTEERLAKSGIDFVRQSCKRLLHPYFFWGIIQITAIILIGRLANRPLEPTSMLYIQILWFPPSQFWFLYSLLLMQFMAFLFYKYLDFQVMLIAAFAALIIVNVVPLPKIMADVARYWVFNAGAIVLARTLRDQSAIQKITCPALVVLIFAWGIAVNFGLWSGGSDSLGNLPAAILGTAMIFRFAASDIISRNKILSALGRRSMPIFLTHVLIVAGIRIAIFNIFHITNVWVVLIIATLMGLLLPCLLYNWAEKHGYLSVLALR